MEYLLILGYLLTFGLAWLIFVTAWRYDHDVTKRDAVFFTFFSVGGPISLVAALIVLGIEALWAFNGGDKVVWRKK